MKSLFKKTFTILLSLILLLCLCACQPSQLPIDETGNTQPQHPQTEPKPTESQPTGSDPTESQPAGSDPTESQPKESDPTEPDPMVAAMQELLNEKAYNRALTPEYATPADVDLFLFFYDGFRDESQKPTDEELQLLEGKLGEYWKEMDLIRLPPEKMDADLMDMFGVKLEQTNKIGLDKLVYLEETGCYYHAITGTYFDNISVQSVQTQDDGSIQVYYLSEGYHENAMVVTLMPKDGGYQVLSNLPVQS